MLKNFLEYQLFSIGSFSLHVYELVGVCIILLVGFIVDRLIKRHFYRTRKDDKGTAYAFYTLSHYMIMLGTFIMVLKVLTIDVSPLLVGGSAVLVGIGLGVQTLFLDFISGVIILFDRSVKVGDVLDMDGVMGKVTKIRLRTSTMESVDNREYIVPNSTIIKNRLVNYSSSGNVNVFTVDMGVDYSTDMDKAQQLMIEAAKETKGVFQGKEPFTRMHEFGEYAVVLRVLFYCENPFGIANVKSDLNKAILRKFREHKIKMPYPIRTIIRYEEDKP